MWCDAVLEEAGRLGAEVLAPLNAIGDRQVRVRERRGARAGRLRAPTGGSSKAAGTAWPFRPTMEGRVCPACWRPPCAIWNAANMAFAICPLLTKSAAKLPLQHSDARMRADYLPKLISEEWTDYTPLTEAQAGSDLAGRTNQGGA